MSSTPVRLRFEFLETDACSRSAAAGVVTTLLLFRFCEVVDIEVARLPVTRSACAHTGAAAAAAAAGATVFRTAALGCLGTTREACVLFRPPSSAAQVIRDIAEYILHMGLVLLFVIGQVEVGLADNGLELVFCEMSPQFLTLRFGDVPHIVQVEA